MRLPRRVGGIVLLLLALTLGAAGCRLAQHPSGATSTYSTTIVGKTTRNLDASQTLWAFVSQFALAS
ncbi:MAG TPA: hypothetical protein VFS83_03955 [Ktedonobacterales bacterium]|nr:hypothetical protein [Ktedonobacterales bacterium]